MRVSMKTSLLASTIALSVAAMSAPTFAQDNPDEDQIVVTGTRLNINPNLTSANPVLTVGDEEIAAQGTVNIEELTNNLPQVFAAQAGEVSNGASGTAQLDLRGLGAVRTLTLIDGRRLPYGSSTSSAPNIDLVPTNLVERVDILTGGASAVYGSDAVAGVANFILKDDFEGAELDVQYGVNQNSNGINRFDEVLEASNVDLPGSVWDGEQVNISAAIGMNSEDGRGNVTVFGSYQNREEIVQRDRSVSACTLSTGDTNGYGCVGSANFRLFAGPGGLGFQEESGNIVDFFSVPATESRFNFGASNFFQRPAERIQIHGKGQYEYADNHEVFFDASYTNNFSDAQIAPSASFGFGAYQINCDNPLIQTPGLNLATDIYGCTAADIAAGNDVSGITASHRNVEGGERNSRLENSAYRLVGGLRGDATDAISYEAFAQFGRTDDESISTNDFIIANLQNAFFAIEDPNNPGEVICRDANARAAGCVPYNVFQRGQGGTTQVTQEALDYIQGVGIVVGKTEQFVIGGNASINLGEYGVKSPLSDDNIGLLVGVEYREDSLDSNPDQISQQPDGGFTGVGGPTLPVQGAVDVLEFFGELEVPLVTDAPYFDELVLRAQYRNSDYGYTGNGTTGGANTDAYGLQLSWAPTSDISFRGQYQRSVRAPNVIELFTGQSTGLPNLTLNSSGLYDPCATNNPSATLEQCQRTGVTSAQFGTILDVISGQTQGIFGGNPNLQPEKSDTYTLGMVFTPEAAPGLTASVDYFNISIDDFIAAGIGAQTTLDQCLATGDSAFCDLITRDSSGSLNSGGGPGIGFLLTNINIAALESEGVDLQVGYNLQPKNESFGSFNLNYAATILTKQDDTSFPGADLNQCTGLFAGTCGRPAPAYRHRAFATWLTPVEDLDATFTWRHYSAVENQALGAAPVDRELSSQNYVDVSANYEIFDGVRLRAGVNNLLLEQPPVTISAGPPFGNGNTYPVIYDTGRYGFVGLNIKL